jgi:hypothetical protein
MPVFGANVVGTTPISTAYVYGNAVADAMRRCVPVQPNHGRQYRLSRSRYGVATALLNRDGEIAPSARLVFVDWRDPFVGVRTLLTKGAAWLILSPIVCAALIFLSLATAMHFAPPDAT